MFTAEDVQGRLRQRPFVPFRIVTSVGESIEVYHPDLVLVGRRDVIVGTASPDNPSVYDQVVRFAMIHITALHDLPVAPSTTTNGTG
jgi:hypothetical protein